MCDDQCRFIQVLNDICHRKCLTGTGDTQKCLTLVAFFEPFDQLFDRFRLIAGWFVFGY